MREGGASPANVAFTGSGGIIIEESYLSKFAKHQANNLINGPFVIALVNLISQGDVEVQNYIAVGLGVYDLAMSGLMGAFGLGVTVLGIALGEFNKKAQAKLDNQHPDKYRGRYFGYVKIGEDWRPAVAKEVSKRTSFGSRDGHPIIEYGDKLFLMQT